MFLDLGKFGSKSLLLPITFLLLTSIAIETDTLDILVIFNIKIKYMTILPKL